MFRKLCNAKPTSCLTGLQMGSFFVEQGSQMDRRISFPRFSIFGHDVRGGQLRIPAASLALFNTVSIIALIPLYDRGLVPLLSRFGKKLSLLQRIGGCRRASMKGLVSAPLQQKPPTAPAHEWVQT